MNIYKTLETKAKLPEFHLYHKTDYNELEKILKELGYKKYDDYNIICIRGYEMKEVIRFIKSKIRKNEKEVIESISKFLLTEEQYNLMESKEQMYYPLITHISPTEI